MRTWCDITRLTHRRNGRRRTLLALIGSIWMFYGLAIYTSPMPSRSFGHLPSLIDQVLTNDWAGLMWAIAGVVGISAALQKRFPDAYGFAALLAPSLLWTVLYAWSWLIWLVTEGSFGNDRAWVMSLIWFFAVAVVFITAGWPDPNDSTIPKPDRTAHDDKHVGHDSVS